jgi:hypothetical protein
MAVQLAKHVAHLCLFANVIPAADSITDGIDAHGRHADGQRDCANDDLPWLGSAQLAVLPEQSGQHREPVTSKIALNWTMQQINNKLSNMA